MVIDENGSNGVGLLLDLCLTIGPLGLAVKPFLILSNPIISTALYCNVSDASCAVEEQFKSIDYYNLKQTSVKFRSSKGPN